MKTKDLSFGMEVAIGSRQRPEHCVRGFVVATNHNYGAGSRCGGSLVTTTGRRKATIAVAVEPGKWETSKNWNPRLVAPVKIVCLWSEHLEQLRLQETSRIEHQQAGVARRAAVAERLEAIRGPVALKRLRCQHGQITLSLDDLERIARARASHEPAEDS